MAIPFDPSNTPLAVHAEANISNRHWPSFTSHYANKTSLSQVDGTTDHHQHTLDAHMRTNYKQPPAPRHQHRHQHQHQAHHVHVSSTQIPPRQQPLTPKNAVSDLLPYCTTELPLSQDQVISLTDAVGSLKELVLLALGAAAGEAGCVERLEGAVGGQGAASIVEFFVDEWEIEG